PPAPPRAALFAGNEHRQAQGPEQDVIGDLGGPIDRTTVWQPQACVLHRNDRDGPSGSSQDPGTARSGRGKDNRQAGVGPKRRVTLLQGPYADNRKDPGG